MCDDAEVIDGPAYWTSQDDGRFLPTGLARSRWGADHLSGPAVVGLAAWALERAYGDPELVPARLTVDLFKAARTLSTSTTVRLARDGRRVRGSVCEVVQNGAVVARASLLQYRKSAPPAGEEWSTTTDFDQPSEFDASAHLILGSDGNSWSRRIGDHQNADRKRTLTHAIDVVESHPVTPFARAAIAAEGTSLVTNLGTGGIGYINGDLTMALTRLPRNGWIGVQADSHEAADGISVGTATLFDDLGAFGRGLVTAISNPDAQIDFANDPLSPATHE